MLDQVLFALANGLAAGMAVFLVAAGVTLIFGLLRILNFAQGSFFMLGAYVAFSIMGPSASSIWVFLLAALVSGVVVAALGLVTDIVVFRRLRDYDEAYTLIATFALMMLLDGLVKMIWGLNYHSISPPPSLAGVLMVGPVIVPIFSLFIIGLGIVVFIILEFAIHRLWIGKIVQALAHDQWMSGFVGINVPVMLTLTVVAAFFLAGAAGGLLLPNQSLSPTLSHAFLLQAFIAVIIGGLGNIRGAFLAALVLGLVESLNAVVLPDQPGVAMYVVMVAFMLWRPAGLLSAGSGDHASPHHATGSAPVDWARYRTVLTWIGVLGAAGIAAMPLWANPGMVFLAGMALIAALFALSWNLLFGTTGLATFGHAAFFAIGCYASGLMLKATGGQWFLAVLVVAALIGGCVAAIVGAVAVRRTTGIALAILTLALSEIMRLLISSSAALGRDDGVSGIPRPNLDLGFITVGLQSTQNYFWFLFVVCGAMALGLWWLSAGPLGRMLRAVKQDPERTMFLGINVGRYRLTAFAISGAVATLAGALQAPWVQIVTPEAGNYLVSMQPMLSSLLGGAAFFWGPVVGTVLFFILAEATRALAGLSEIVTGGVLLLLVMLAPDGVLGIIGRFRSRKQEATSEPKIGFVAKEVRP
ncbi:MAG: ABC transporter permease [Chelatococcus sp.]|jgi:branched-chain amino acid transport system permease protein|uniref:ABC transporter permease n=1 Tax=Chelatococcus sp. TaxID=1953771 RepID=UPI0025BDCC36|nr:ABC transporter permease [Chelatococcus sp.]MBX3539368.1 ABC transporter permease [Chelatococcus sp.]